MILKQRDFPGGPVVKNPPANTGNMGLIPPPGRSRKEEQTLLAATRESPRAAMKTQCSLNKYILKNDKESKIFFHNLQSCWQVLYATWNLFTILKGETYRNLTFFLQT